MCSFAVFPDNNRLRCIVSRHALLCIALCALQPRLAAATAMSAAVSGKAGPDTQPLVTQIPSFWIVHGIPLLAHFQKPNFVRLPAILVHVCLCGRKRVMGRTSRYMDHLKVCEDGPAILCEGRCMAYQPACHTAKRITATTGCTWGNTASEAFVGSCRIMQSHL